MEGEPLDVLAESIGVETYGGSRDPAGQFPSAYGEHAGVGHVLRDRMLEGVFRIWEDAALVDKLSRRQMGEYSSQRLLGLLCDRREQLQGHVRADDCHGLK